MTQAQMDAPPNDPPNDSLPTAESTESNEDEANRTAEETSAEPQLSVREQFAVDTEAASKAVVEAFAAHSGS